MALTPRDNALLQAAANGATAEELGKVLNLDPVKAVLRVQELLRDADIWSELERRQLLLVDLYRLKASLQKQVEDTDFDSKDVSNLLKAFATIAGVLDKSSQITNSQLERVTAVQAVVIQDMVLHSYAKAKQILVAQYPDADVDAIDAAFIAGLRESYSKATNPEFEMKEIAA